MDANQGLRERLVTASSYLQVNFGVQGAKAAQLLSVTAAQVYINIREVIWKLLSDNI